jgi:hypothetical protein
MTEAKSSVCKLFAQRMAREGRTQQWQDAVASAQAESGKGFGAIKWSVMKSLGYESPERERELHAAWLAGEQAKTDDAAATIAQAQASVAECDSSFEAALATLPLKADRQGENDWILSHLALTRRARSENKDEPVRLTADDILKSSHGPAPSRAAAIRLQLFVDNPDELSKALTAPVKKDDGIDSGRDSEFVKDDGIGEVERLLDQVSSESERIKDAVELLTSKGYGITLPQGGGDERERQMVA